jgi:hypothetical protein
MTPTPHTCICGHSILDHTAAGPHRCSRCSCQGASKPQPAVQMIQTASPLLRAIISPLAVR